MVADPMDAMNLPAPPVSILFTPNQSNNAIPPCPDSHAKQQPGSLWAALGNTYTHRYDYVSPRTHPCTLKLYRYAQRHKKSQFVY